MLTVRDHTILTIANRTYKYAGTRDTDIRTELNMSPTRYAQVLNALIDRPEALEADPLLVRRLRRLRASRQRQRSARRLGFDI